MFEVGTAIDKPQQLIIFVTSQYSIIFCLELHVLVSAGPVDGFFKILSYVKTIETDLVISTWKTLQSRVDEHRPHIHRNRFDPSVLTLAESAINREQPLFNNPSGCSIVSL